MKILIVSHYFPPHNSIASLRPYSWAKYWSELGHDVTVLTTRKGEEISDDGKFKVVYVSSLYSRLFKKISSVKVAENKSRKSIFRSFFKGLHGRLQSMGAFTWDSRMPNIVSTFHRTGYEKVKDESWDLVISTFAPYSSHIIGYKLKKSGSAKKWIADYRDLWCDNHMYSGVPIIRIYENWLEKNILKEADCITTVSKPLADTLKDKVDDINKVKVIPNGYDFDDEVVSTQPCKKQENSKIEILYTGSIYSGFRDPSLLFSGISELKKQSVNVSDLLKITFAGSAKGDLDLLINKFDVADVVEHIGMVPRNEVLGMQRNVDYLLLLESGDPKAAGVITGKVFEYIASETPMIIIGPTKRSELGMLANQYSSAIFLESVSESVIFLKTILSGDSINFGSENKGNVDFKMQYSRKVLAEKVLRFIE
uniref:Glycosyltransferase subfamily 4-like N-terminal domain-containing protein n=1 Tax=Marinomonas sp. (strain MWYL1) TaxID=400668 RepID=A6VTI9_MARMS